MISPQFVKLMSGLDVRILFNILDISDTFSLWKFGVKPVFDNGPDIWCLVGNYTSNQCLHRSTTTLTRITINCGRYSRKGKVGNISLSPKTNKWCPIVRYRMWSIITKELFPLLEVLHNNCQKIGLILNFIMLKKILKISTQSMR